jgi:prolyl oligopeptidase
MKSKILPLSLLIGFSAFAQAPMQPVAPVKPVEETYFGQKISDPYRYLENTGDPDVQQWMHAQADYTRATLDALPGRKKMLADIQSLVNEQAGRANNVSVCGKTLFYTRRQASDTVEKIYVREPNRPERMLFDPAPLAPAGSHVAIANFDPSSDCRYLAVAVASGGAENTALHVYSVADGHEIGPSVERVISLAWIPGQDAMIIGRRNEMAKGAPPSERLLKIKSYVHKIGTDPQEDRLIFGYGVDPKIPIDPAEIPGVYALPGSRHLMAVISHIRGPIAIYVAPLEALAAETIEWKQVATPQDDVWFAVPHGDDLYLVSHKNAPRFQVLKTSAVAPDLATAKVVLPQSESVLLGSQGLIPVVALNSIMPARDALYVTRFDGASGEYVRVPYTPGAKPEVLTPPRASAVDGVAYDAREDGAYFRISSWTEPDEYVRALPKQNKMLDAGIDPRQVIADAANLVTEDVVVRAKDGVDVPLSITYLRGLKRDGTAPAVMEAYGSYGTVLSPYFEPSWLALLRHGAIIATPHVRGGGELGEEWHVAGQKQNKPNTWQDLIACAEYLVANHYTSPSHLGIMGGSAGGIPMGRSLEERPDLFAAVVDAVGVSDMLRMELGPVGPANIGEFGSVKTEDGFRALLAMSPYHHVENGKRYPAVLLDTGINDPRVPAWHAAKFAARLQAASTSGKPILLRVDYDAGHVGASMKQRQERQADIFSFFLWQFGEPGFGL